jgi:hypothetical protein
MVAATAVAGYSGFVRIPPMPTRKLSSWMGHRRMLLMRRVCGCSESLGARTAGLSAAVEMTDCW